MSEKTKGEAIVRHFISASHDEDRNKVYVFPPGGLFKAMDEYADQEKRSTAIAFAKWKEDNAYKASGKSYKLHSDADKAFALGQLYDLYLQSLSK